MVLPWEDPGNPDVVACTAPVEWTSSGELISELKVVCKPMYQEQPGCASIKCLVKDFRDPLGSPVARGHVTDTSLSDAGFVVESGAVLSRGAWSC